ncbi:hypothetical protein ABZ281_49885, partial [Streptomyces sp. NPDC006265]
VQQVRQDDTAAPPRGHRHPLDRYIAPAAADAQVLVVLAVTVMAVEMAIGFAVVTALFRSREVDMTDMAAELKE